MQQADFTRFRNVMAGMAELYSRELSKTLLDVYWLALKDWTLADFEGAAGKLMTTATFMPKPAEFTAIRKAALPTGATAWFTKGVSEDPIANKAMHIAAQGRYVGHIPLDKLDWVQKRFIEAYEDLQESEQARKALPSLAQDQNDALTDGAALRRLIGGR